MQFDIAAYKKMLTDLEHYHATLVAVTKLKSVDVVREAYSAGQRDFGENYVQEMVSKAAELPQDIRWHFIGHLQTNKVKMIAPFVWLIHGVDSLSLLKEINKQAKKHKRVIDCLLQVHIAEEETKFGLSIEEAEQLISHAEFHSLSNVCVRGLMGMASMTTDKKKITAEFHSLSLFFARLQSMVYSRKKLNGHKPKMQEGVEELSTPKEVPVHSNLLPEILSMGMSGDYRIALEEGSTMVRIGSLLFGTR